MRQDVPDENPEDLWGVGEGEKIKVGTFDSLVGSDTVY